MNSNTIIYEKVFVEIHSVKGGKKMRQTNKSIFFTNGDGREYRYSKKELESLIIAGEKEKDVLNFLECASYSNIKITKKRREMLVRAIKKHGTMLNSIDFKAVPEIFFDFPLDKLLYTGTIDEIGYLASNFKKVIEELDMNNYTLIADFVKGCDYDVELCYTAMNYLQDMGVRVIKRIYETYGFQVDIDWLYEISMRHELMDVDVKLFYDVYNDYYDYFDYNELYFI